jgi:hypothetical protein
MSNLPIHEDHLWRSLELIDSQIKDDRQQQIDEVNR